ncbi:segregation and condensation protein A [Macrococcoides caseolyticum]|uniref:segregation and condensation protein A n=1 Tax=Macrococcoides caseolyticum TaxID=69966 RepID=UPI0024BC0013|nr:segregation/condensation protein A [Macrococcus caseolyticus]MDJ1088331.1 segregation/condensation protein A [Macrococcus caseolyticus]
MYEVKLASFHGPLDLLLHLIKQYEIDIYDISMKILTEQYINYIKDVTDLDINVHGDYLVMASELLRIKSRMLLPESTETVEETEDPREGLMNQLIEYQNYRMLAEILNEKKKEEEKYFIKRGNDLSRFEKVDTSLELELVDLITAYYKAKQRQHVVKPTISMARDTYSIEDATKNIIENLQQKQSITFADFVTFSETKTQIVTLFMALLELMKTETVKIRQELTFGDIYIERGRRYNG